MRFWLALVVVLALPPQVSATSVIARSFAGLLRDAEAVVAGQVGEVTDSTAAFRVERVLSGAPGRVLVLPVVRCNEPGPDGTTYSVDGCQDRTYQTGERLLLVLVRDQNGIRESGYPSHTRFSLPSDAEARARRLLALSETDPQARAAALAAMLGDPRAAWQRDAAQAADPFLTMPLFQAFDPAGVLVRTLALLSEPLREVLVSGATAQARAAAATALGRSHVESWPVTLALLGAARDADPELAWAATLALRFRADPAPETRCWRWRSAPRTWTGAERCCTPWLPSSARIMRTPSPRSTASRSRTSPTRRSASGR